MFIGEYIHTIDHKGRIAIPSKFRAKIAAGCTITKGLDNALFIFPQEEWDKLAAKLTKLPLSQADARAFARLMFSGAVNIESDKQGRIVIPLYLREYADLKNEVIVCGVFSRIEIWNKKRWQEYKTNSEKESNNIAEHLSDLGI